MSKYELKKKRVKCANPECDNTFLTAHGRKYCCQICISTVRNRRLGSKPLQPFSKKCKVTGLPLSFWTAPDELCSGEYVQSKIDEDVDPVKLNPELVRLFRLSTIGRK